MKSGHWKRYHILVWSDCHHKNAFVHIFLCGLVKTSLCTESLIYSLFFVFCLCFLCQFVSGWVHGEHLCENTKVHPRLKPYRALAEKVQMK